jgi:hypothetical protein
MKKKPIEIACPFCKAAPGRHCTSAEGHKMRGFHRQRYTKKTPREDFSQTAARIVREATEKV